jgi:hypothetical protein
MTEREPSPHPSVTRQDLALGRAQLEIEIATDKIESAITYCVVAGADEYAAALNLALVLLGKHPNDPMRVVDDNDGERVDYVSEKSARFHRINLRGSISEVSTYVAGLWYSTFIAPRLERLPISELVKSQTKLHHRIQQMEREQKQQRGEQ